MAVTIATAPALLLVGKTARVTFGCTGGGNAFRVWVTNAPPETKWRAELDTGTARIEVFAGTVGETWTFVPEHSGVYTLVAQEYIRGAASHGGRYQGDPGGFQSEALVGGEDTLQLFVLTPVETRLGVSPDTATLLVYASDETIVPTTVAIHGVATPAIVNPQTDRARLAAEDSTVRTLVAALAGQNADTALGDISDAIDDFVENYQAHRILTTASVHANSDGDNLIVGIPAGPKSSAQIIESVRKLAQALDRHERNDLAGAGTDTAESAYHQVTARQPDLLNNPLTVSVGDLNAAHVVFADCWRAYEAHRVQIADPAVHGAADSTNTLAALPAVLGLHEAFTSAVQSASAPTEHDAVSSLVRNGWRIRR